MNLISTLLAILLYALIVVLCLELIFWIVSIFEIAVSENSATRLPE